MAALNRRVTCQGDNARSPRRIIRAPSSVAQSRSKQAGGRTFIPIRPRISADCAAHRANHARAERWHGQVIDIGGHVQDRFVITPKRATPDVQRVDTVFAHVA
jgi:hypothetical protein